jgi:organic radical activating enzyme
MNESTIATNTLPVMEYFYTLQGEGYHQGRAAYFIRLGGCDVGCVGLVVGSVVGVIVGCRVG